MMLEILPLKIEMNIFIVIYMQFKVSPKVYPQAQVGNPQNTLWMFSIY